jgi:hypothetical protein
MKNIMQDALSYLNVPLDYQNQIPKAYTWMDEKTYVVPSYIGYEKKQVKSSYFNFKFIGEGNIVTSQTPLPGTMLEANSTIMLLLNE